MELGDSMANVNIANIKAPKSPNLPIAPNAYSQLHFNTLNDVLRLYFNQLDIIYKYLITPDVGRYLNFPFLAVLDDTIQTASSGPGVAYPVSWSTPYLPTFYAGPNEFTPYIDLVDSSKIVIPDSHYFNFSYTLNFVKSTAGSATVAVWWRLNSAFLPAPGYLDYPGSTRYYIVLGSGAPTAANCTLMTDEQNGDSWQLMWTTSDAGVVLTPTPGAVIGPEPTGASAALSISFVNA